MSALADPEDAPPLEPARVYPEHAPTLKPPAPSPSPDPRPTVKMPAARVAELNAEAVRHEATRVAETMERIDAILPLLATKRDLEPLDRGIRMAVDAADSASSAVAQLRGDLMLWLFGDEHRPGITQGIDATNKAAHDALVKATQALEKATEAAAEAKTAATAALEASKLSKAVYDKVYHPTAGDNAQLLAPAGESG